MNGLQEQWMHHLERERRVSPETVRSYRKVSAMYLKYLEKIGVDPRSATRQHIKDYYASLVGAPATVSQRMYVVRSFHRWLHEEAEAATTNPTLGIRVPGVPETLTPPPRQGAIFALLDSYDTTTYRGVRDRAAASILYGCGLRVCELRNLRFQDADLAGRRLYVRGKGNNRRNVPIPASTTRDIAAWLAVREPVPVDYLFPGNTQDGRRGYEAIYASVKSAARRAGLDERRIHPHVLRHAFAVHLLASGVDIRRIQRLLGHKNIQTTCTYLQIEVSDLAESIDKHHPLSFAKPAAAARARTANPWSGWMPAA